MKFRDYFAIPQNILTVPAGTLDEINEDAAAHGGVIKVYFPHRRHFPIRGKEVWITVWQLVDYNIDTDKMVHMYPYRKVKQKKTMPDPDPKAVDGRRCFTPDMLPPPLMYLLRDAAHYYKVRAKR